MSARVLLVEDNPVGALLAKTLLRREGCVVQTAAEQGIELAAIGPSALPGQDGNREYFVHLRPARPVRPHAAGATAPGSSCTPDAQAYDMIGSAVGGALPRRRCDQNAPEED